MIVFPMVGMSSRFFKAGYTKPKYMLDIDGRPCFDYSVAGFLSAYRDDHFVFVMRGDYETPEFVRGRLAALGIKDYSIVVVDDVTKGQAETVERGLEGISEAGPNGLAIFNIDTFRINFELADAKSRGDGFLETFIGNGDNWSFVLPDELDDGRALKTTEKNPVSDHCCTGFYHFSTLDDFKYALSQERKKPSMNELYVAPLYNHLIAKGRNIRYTTVDVSDVVFCGIPREYEDLVSAESGAQRERLRSLVEQKGTKF